MSEPRTDRPAAGGYSFLLAALAVLLLSDLVLLAPQVAGHVTAAAETAVLIAGVYAISRQRWVLITTIALSLPTIAGLWLMAGLGVRPPWLVVLTHVLLLALFSFFLWYTVAGVLHARRVTGDTIRGAICGYLLIAVVFAGLYSLTEVLTEGNAFSVHASMAPPETSMTWFHHIDPEPGASSRNELTYFSFTTLTTLGYGDVVPTHRSSRTLSSLEAVVGQLYLAILIAGLVGAYLSSKRETEG